MIFVPFVRPRNKSGDWQVSIKPRICSWLYRGQSYLNFEGAKNALYPLLRGAGVCQIETIFFDPSKFHLLKEGGRCFNVHIV